MTPQTLTLTAPADFLSKNYLWHIFGSEKTSVKHWKPKTAKRQAAPSSRGHTPPNLYLVPERPPRNALECGFIYDLLDAQRDASGDCQAFCKAGGGSMAFYFLLLLFLSLPLYGCLSLSLSISLSVSIQQWPPPCLMQMCFSKWPLRNSYSRPGTCICNQPSIKAEAC